MPSGLAVASPELVLPAEEQIFALVETADRIEARGSRALRRAMQVVRSDIAGSIGVGTVDAPELRRLSCTPESHSSCKLIV